MIPDHSDQSLAPKKSILLQPPKSAFKNPSSKQPNAMAQKMESPNPKGKQQSQYTQRDGSGLGRGMGDGINHIPRVSKGKERVSNPEEETEEKQEVSTRASR